MRVRIFRSLLLVAVAMLAATVTMAQGTPTVDEQPAASSDEATQVPALFSVGVSGGFPSYQTVALAVSLQSSFVGLQAKGSWTPAGPYLGLQVRGYPPVPVPVPLFVGLGVGVYGPNVSYHAAVGAHVPLARAVRLDIEGGIASVPLLAERTLAPHLVVGVSYAVPVDIARSTSERIGSTVEARSATGTAAPSCSEPREPDASALDDAVEATVDDWIASARATYGSIYADLSYDYSTNADVSGDKATVTVSYSGSVREIATGVRHEASGTATAEFAWTGCFWAGRGVSY